MAPAATVLIPTHDHGPLLRFSLESALAQTVPDLEVFVVGDGALDLTREIAAEFMQRDDRVRFFDHPKGPRRGDAYRHVALAEATSDAVIYLSDDDLWLPEHVETMIGALQDHDLVSAVAFRIYPDGRFKVRRHDVSRHRERLLGGGRGIPLSCAAHTLAAYRALPFGWRTAPIGVKTDKYMWQQFVAQPTCRVGTTSRVTVLSLSSAWRRTMTLSDRRDELETWWERVCDPLGRAEIHARACAYALEETSVLIEKQQRAREKIDHLRAAAQGSRLARLLGR